MQYKEYVTEGIEDAEYRRAKLLSEHGFHDFEVMEIKQDQFSVTGFPNPKNRYHLILHADQLNLEKVYYDILSLAVHDFSMPYTSKIVDSSAASVSSSMFGDQQARLNAQQNSVTNLMATVGRMSKDLYGIINDIRKVRERLGLYQDAETKDGKVNKKAQSAETTLRATWTDLVEQGTQNPSSVIGLAQKVGYAVLPNLFFGAPPLTEETLSDYVEKLDFNSDIKNMLKRKLFQYYRWKKETYWELRNKIEFLKRSLRQQFDGIRLYLAWLRPYLKQVEQLHFDESKLQHDAWLVSAFQSQIIELETAVYADAINDVHPVVLFHFFHRSTPSMDFHQKDAWQQKGPVHVGRTEVTIRTYAWTQKQLQAYQKMRQKEDFTMLSTINDSLKAAFEQMDQEMIRFLQEGEGGIEIPDEFLPDWAKKNKEKKKDYSDERRETIYDPFVDVGKGMLDVFKPVMPWEIKNPFSTDKKDADAAKAKKKEGEKKAAKSAQIAAFMSYKLYKKANGHFAY